MKSDDYMRLVFIILNEVYAALRAGRKVDTELISPEGLSINSSYLIEILIELDRLEYVKGLSVRGSSSGRKVSNIENLVITMSGVEFLQNNDSMKKVYEIPKEVKDWIPGW